MAGWKTHYLPDLCGLLKGYRMEHGGLSDLAAFAFKGVSNFPAAQFFILASSFDGFCSFSGFDVCGP